MSSKYQEKQIATDVLIIGGGLAGIFAAIKAKEKGCDVTLVDKSYIGTTSGAHFAEGDIFHFRPDKGHNLDDWVDQITVTSEYLNNRDWDKYIISNAEKCYNELVSWGIGFYQENGKIIILTQRNGEKTMWEDIHLLHHHYMPALRKIAIKSGIKLMDRIMVSDLIKQDGNVIGAIGFHTTSGDIYIFNAGATIIATGGVGQLKASGSDIHQYTGDGDAMAYRAGAEITGKEFAFWTAANRKQYKSKMAQVKKKQQAGLKVDDTMFHFPFVSIQSGFPFPDSNADGEPLGFLPWDIHCGKGPISANLAEQRERIRLFFRRTGSAEIDKLGIDLENTDVLTLPAGKMGDQLFGGTCGIWPVGTTCATKIPGLYVAGNSCAGRGGGARYAGMGWGLNHAMVTGTSAGINAAAYAASNRLKANKTAIDRVKQTIIAPVERKGGFSPTWVAQVLRGFFTPYFITAVKHKDRLEPALKLVEFLNSHVVPRMMAKDPHEWRMVQETRNMVLNSEMVLRASLYRTESRGSHFREDYPRRDDPTWLVWIKLKEQKGAMKLIKEPVPREWWPDLTKPYEERYPSMFPLEDE